MKPQQQTFTKIRENLRKSTKFNMTDKVFLSYIIDFQDNNLKCFQSNKTIADELGLTVAYVKKLIVRLSKTNILKSEVQKFDNAAKHTLTVDESLLAAFLAGKEQVIVEPIVINKPKEIVKPQVEQPMVFKTRPKSFQFTNPLDFLSTYVSYLISNYPTYSTKITDAENKLKNNQPSMSEVANVFNSIEGKLMNQTL